MPKLNVLVISIEIGLQVSAIVDRTLSRDILLSEQSTGAGNLAKLKARIKRLGLASLTDLEDGEGIIVSYKVEHLTDTLEDRVFKSITDCGFEPIATRLRKGEMVVSGPSASVWRDIAIYSRLRNILRQTPVKTRICQAA